MSTSNCANSTGGVGHCSSATVITGRWDDPAKLAWRIKSQYRLCGYSVSSAKARLQSSTYTVCIETTEKSPNHGKIELSNAFISNFLHWISEVGWKTPLKITFSICVPKLVDVRTAVLRNWWRKLGKICVLRDFPPLVSVYSRNLKFLTSVTNTQWSTSTIVLPNKWICKMHFAHFHFVFRGFLYYKYLTLYFLFSGKGHGSQNAKCTLRFF